MKMGFLASGIFWGSLVILFGLSIILNAVFGISIPLFRIVFALILIYFGIKTLAGGALQQDKNNAVFNEKTINISSKNADQHNVIFGSANFDLSSISLETGSVSKEITVVFGYALITLPANTPVRIKATSAFGSAAVPNNNSVVFGDTFYTSPSYKEGMPFVDIKATVVFGSLDIKF